MEPRSKRDNESTTMDNPKLNSERGNEPTMTDKSKPEDSKGTMKLLQRTNPNKIKMDNDSTMMAKHSPKKQTGQWKTQFPLKGVLRVKGVLGPRARVKGSKLKLCTRAHPGPHSPRGPLSREIVLKSTMMEKLNCWWSTLSSQVLPSHAAMTTAATAGDRFLPARQWMSTFCSAEATNRITEWHLGLAEVVSRYQIYLHGTQGFCI